MAMALSRAMMHAVSADSETLALASDAFRSFVRAYATHPKVRDGQVLLEGGGHMGQELTIFSGHHPPPSTPPPLQDVKDIFNVRQLHLGHVAFSFGLRDPPAMIGQSGASAERKRKKHAQGLAANKQVRVWRGGEEGSCMCGHGVNKLGVCVDMLGMCWGWQLNARSSSRAMLWPTRCLPPPPPPLRTRRGCTPMRDRRWRPRPTPRDPKRGRWGGGARCAVPSDALARRKITKYSPWRLFLAGGGGYTWRQP